MGPIYPWQRSPASQYSIMMQSHVTVLVALLAVGSGLRQECGPCDKSDCPSACISSLSDPCACCDFVCGVQEGEPCEPNQPCEPDLTCAHSPNGEVCSCREDKRMVCGSNEVTYASICQFKKDTAESNLTMKLWGPCEFAPKIVSPPTNTKLTIGEPMALDCEVKGYPIPTVTWTFTGRDGKKKQLPSDDHWTAVQLRGGPEHLMVTSWVQIIESRSTDAGYYQCRAKNTLGSISAEAVVSVRHHHHRG